MGLIRLVRLFDEDIGLFVWKAVAVGLVKGEKLDLFDGEKMMREVV